MTEISPSTLARRIALQRLAMTWERLWAAAHELIVVGAAALALIASGAAGFLPAPLRLVVLGLFAALMFFALRGFKGFALPTRLDAMRRMECQSAARHRPLSSSDETLAREILDPRMDAVWEEHKRRQLLALHDVRLSPPRSHWPTFDPRALKVPALMGLLAALLLGPGSVTGNLQEAVRLSPAEAAKPLSLDAWLKPPAYTGKAPLLLSSSAIRDKLTRGEDLLVPEQTLFTARIAGAHKPDLTLLDSTGAALKDVGGPLKLARPQEDTLTAELSLQRPLTIVISDESGELARYPIALVPDVAPTITITKTPTAEARGTLVTEWQAKDDYGVRSLSGEIDLADEQDGGLGFDSNGIFLFEAPEVKFALRRANAKDETGKTTHDLASHPWAGFNVNLTLTVKDGASQEATSAPATFKLPEREFIRPMAQAIIEQRKQLILNPQQALEVGSLFDTLLLYPAGVLDRSGHVVALSALASRLRNAGGYDDVKLVIAGLWDLAVEIEEGAVGDVRAELQALKKELEKALQDGASPERIAELMDKMRDAMDRFMEAMRQEAERRQKDGTLPRNRQGQQGQRVTREDLEKMLDALENLAQGGAKDMAQQLLNELDRMLQNMQPGEGQQAEGGEMSEMMGELGEMMQRQQGLMDETQRQPGGQQPGEEGQDGQGTDGQGLGEQGMNGEGFGGLSRRQGTLQDQLEGLLGQVPGGQGQLPSELGDASRAMEGAEQSLRNGDRDGALRQQGEALQNLRRGANRLAQQLRENGQGQAENEALDGEGRGGRDDPLGRPRATRNPDTGPEDNMLPSEQAMQRAREILETLRAKSNEQGLTDSERGYIERLLRGLY